MAQNTRDRGIMSEKKHATAVEGTSAPSTRVGRRRWLLGAAGALVAALILASGAGGWWLATSTVVASQENATQPLPTADPGPVGESQMPDVRGLDRAAAEQVLADSGVPIGAISLHDAPSVASVGVVVEQSPAFGSSAIDAVELGLAVPVTMPDVVGLTQQEAVSLLSGFGAGVELGYGYANASTPGTVLSGVPGAGEPLGQTAVLVVATAGSTLPLSELSPLSGGCSTQSDVAINGQDHPTALVCGTSAGAPAETTWLLSKTVDRLTATVGIVDQGSPGSAAAYQVLLDGVVVAEGTAAFGSSTTIDVPCSGAIQLAVRVSPSVGEKNEFALADAVVYGSDEGIARLATLR